MHPTSNSVTATGVEFIHGGKTLTASASREVILSAGKPYFRSFAGMGCSSFPYFQRTGSFKSPQLLEISGIGNPSIIEPLGIETVIGLPSVGENLRESCIA